MWVWLQDLLLCCVCLASREAWRETVLSSSSSRLSDSGSSRQITRKITISIQTLKHVSGSNFKLLCVTRNPTLTSRATVQVRSNQFPWCIILAPPFAVRNPKTVFIYVYKA